MSTGARRARLRSLVALRLLPLPLVALAVAAPAGAGDPVEIAGTWRVRLDDELPDARDASSRDVVWSFEPSANGLRWTQYPNVLSLDPLDVSPDGAESETLRGSPSEGWRSPAPIPSASASVLTYGEVWSIEGAPDAPTFRREESLLRGGIWVRVGGSAYTTTEVREGGAVLVGRFEGDDLRRGSFRMRRSRGPARVLAAAPRRSAGQVLLPVPPSAAGHDDSVRYRLPFAGSVPRRLAQGVGSDEPSAPPLPPRLPFLFGAAGPSHRGPHRYAFDFEMPVGSPVLAARAGVVVGVGNAVLVLHADGTTGAYARVAETLVSLDESVAAGRAIARSGSDAESFPHLHFGVYRADAGGFASVPIRFDDGTPEGYVPVTGLFYGGRPE